MLIDTIPFEGEIQEKLTVMRQIALIFMNAPSKPCAMLEGITRRIPRNQVIPLARPSSQDEGSRLSSGQYHAQSWFWFHLAIEVEDTLFWSPRYFTPLE
jgi:hypothetical protein